MPAQQYIAEFTGHLNRSRPDAFPKVIKDYQMFEVDTSLNSQQTKRVIAQEINKMTGNYVWGMSVFLDSQALIDTTKLQLKTFVPMHLITHITCVVKPLTGGTTIDSQGNVHTPDGEEVPIQ